MATLTHHFPKRVPAFHSNRRSTKPTPQTTRKKNSTSRYICPNNASNMLTASVLMGLPVDVPRHGECGFLDSLRTLPCKLKRMKRSFQSSHLYLSRGGFRFVSEFLQFKRVRSALEVFLMTITRSMKMAAIVFVLLPVFAVAQEQEQEKKIQRSDLPQAVEKTVVEQSRGATIKGFSQEEENGQTLYEAEMIVNGHSKDVEMDQNGSVVAVEEQVQLESLPQEVRAGLQSKAGSGKIVKVESISKKNALVAYEAKVMSNGKKSEIQVGPDGKPLDHEE